VEVYRKSTGELEVGPIGQKPLMERAVTLPPDLHELRRARALADETSATSPLLDTIRIVIAELASNAIEHAHSTFTVTVSEDRDGMVTVAVHDHSAALPVLQPQSTLTARGRGLQIVDQLAAEWGATAEPDDGKTVWATLSPS
jgi:anti-sigma regulatory factor (Ser/Thr protein kinase)